MSNEKELSGTTNIIVLKNILSPLEEVPKHNSVEGITRFYCKNFPYHTAIHYISEGTGHNFSSTDHCHEADEINLLISEETLVLEYEIDGEKIIAEAPCSVLIKKNVHHKSRVLSGKGIFVCVILTDTERAYRLEN